MRKVVFLGSGQYLLKPMLTLAMTGALFGCGSLDEEPEPRSLDLQNITLIGSEDETLLSSVNQNLGDDVTYTIVAPPSDGSLIFSGNGDFEYVPDSNFNGIDTFQFQAQCEECITESAIAQINVAPVNDLPEISPVSIAGIGIAPITGQFMAIDIDGDDLQFSVYSAGSFGETTITSTGEFTYTPSQAISGQDQVQIAVSDGSEIAITNLTIDLTASSLSVSSEDTYFVEQRSLIEASMRIDNILPQGVPVLLSSMPSWFVGDVDLTVPANGAVNVDFIVDAGVLELGMLSGQIELIDGLSGAVVSHTLNLDVTHDVTPPGAVTDLSASLGDDHGDAVVTWTSVMDNINENIPASAYELRYALEPIDEDNWSTSTLVIDVPTPSLPGQLEQAFISGLLPETTYYFAIRSSDLSALISPISNVVSLTTPIIENLELLPSSSSVSLSEGDVAEINVVLRNNTAEPVDYSAVVNELEPTLLGARGVEKLRTTYSKRQMPKFTKADIAKSNGIIVKRKSDQGASLKVFDAFSRNGLSVEKTLKKLNVDVVSAKGKTQQEIADTINYLNSLPDVIYAEPDYLVHTTATPNDALFTQQWAVNNEGQTGGSFDADIDATEVWDYSVDGSNVVVAVIDTGVNYNHEDLANNMWVNAAEIPGNGIDDDANGFIDDIHGFDFVNNDGDPIDDHDHGTHCAGIIGAEGNNGVGIAGAVHNAQIMAVKFLSASGGGNTSDAIESVIYAVDNGADILSNSWGGGGFSQALMDAITYANDNDVMFIAAAGNSSVNNDLSPHYPSSYTNENVISVASTTHSDGMSYFSNFGLTSVDLGAPGSDILSSVSGGGYASFSGTSMATPYVAGAAVLIRSNFPELSAAQVKQILLASVDGIPALDGNTVTGGRLNIDSAFAMAMGQSSMVRIVSDAQGVIAANSTIEIPVSINAINAELGNYPFTIDFDFSDSIVSSLIFDLTVDVIPDVLPPALIDDLQVNTVSSDSVSLYWTNTGDDGFEGVATEVQIAYSEGYITEENWSSLPKLAGIVPEDSGVVQQAFITGLPRSTNYNLAIRSLDNAGNYSELSNIVSATTLAGPDMSLTPGLIDTVVLTVGESEVVDLGVQNIGDEVLNYSLQVNSDSLPLPTAMANPQALNLSVELAKGANDVRVGEAVVAGSGGPDAYGYRWDDSDEGGATYDWRDISSLGSSMTFSDDSVTGPLSLGFDFEFYGEIQSQVWVSSNGFISFDSPAHSGCCTGQPIPSADGFNNMIAWAWDDLYPRSGYTAHYLAEADKFTIQFTNYGEYAANGLVTAQIIIYQNGRIKLQYKEFTGGFDTLRSSIGIENADGTDGLQVAFNTGYLHDELAVEFFSGPDWVGLSQSSGELEPGLNDSIGITFDSSAQSIGSYEAALHVMSNDADQPEVVIPLRMEVVAP